jgi:hypothetical protein
MSSHDELFARLAKSRFRSRFRLNAEEQRYLMEKGLATVLAHARDFNDTRHAGARPRNDGKQTPMRGHPVFLAQHDTATCCRGCLAKWHAIAVGRELSPGEREHIVCVIAVWLGRQG